MDEDWDVLLSFFPRDWRELARDTGALKGLRKDKSVDNLLRTLLLHLGCGHSLRETAVRAPGEAIRAWAAPAGPGRRAGRRARSSDGVTYAGGCDGEDCRRRGAVMLALPEDVVERLGAQEVGGIARTYADGRQGERPSRVCWPFTSAIAGRTPATWSSRPAPIRWSVELDQGRAQSGCGLRGFGRSAAGRSRLTVLWCGCEPIRHGPGPTRSWTWRGGPTSSRRQARRRLRPGPRPLTAHPPQPVRTVAYGSSAAIGQRQE